jgi:hypothetical protein
MNVLLRLLGRSVVALLVSACVLLIAVQYFHVIHHTVMLARELTSAQREIADLRALRARQLSEIRRLSDPHGSIPEIHDQLRYVGKNETLIYLESDATLLPAPYLTNSAAPF